MQKVSAALVAFSFMFFSQSALSVDVFGAYGSCGAWMDRTDNKIQRLQRESWVDGFLSGMAAGTFKEFWSKPGNKLDDKSVYLWIDNYCRANPLKNVAQAAEMLFLEHTRK